MAEESHQIDETFKPLLRSYVYGSLILSVDYTRKELEKRSEWALAITGGMVIALIVSGNAAPGHVLWQTKGLLVFLLLSSVLGIISRFMKVKHAPEDESYPITDQFLNLIKSGDASRSEMTPGFRERLFILRQTNREVAGIKGKLTDEEFRQDNEELNKGIFEGGNYRKYKSSVERKGWLVNLQLISAFAGVILYCLAVLLMF
jgi:hypothetical protein